LDEFKKNINPNSFLAISISITEFIPALNLIKQFPDCIFHKIMEPPDSWPVKNNVETWAEKNIDKKTYLIFELINQIKKDVQLEH
jgi:hypothetical protein